MTGRDFIAQQIAQRFNVPVAQVHVYAKQEFDAFVVVVENHDDALRSCFVVLCMLQDHSIAVFDVPVIDNTGTHLFSIDTTNIETDD